MTCDSGCSPQPNTLAVIPDLRASLYFLLPLYYVKHNNTVM